MGWHVPFSKDLINPTKVLATRQMLIGSGTPFGLEEELRKDGLVYALRSEYCTGFEQNFFTIEAHYARGNSEIIEEKIIEKIKKLQKGEVDKEIFKIQKKNIMFDSTLTIDSPSSQLMIMNQEKFGDYDFRDMISIMSKLTPKDVAEGAHYLDTNRYVIVSEYPKKRFIEKILKL